MTLPPVPVVIMDGERSEASINAVIISIALLSANDASSSIAVLAPSRKLTLARAADSWLTDHGHSAEVVSHPPRGLLSGWRSDWASVPIANPDARFPKVSLNRAVAPPRRLWLALELDDASGLPVDVLIRYVHPRLSAAVQLSRPDLGSAADVALAFNTVAVLLSATVRGRPVVAGTSDIVAAHLLALAFQALSMPAGEDRIGPWEDPTVQRATELGLGVIHPGQLDLTCRPTGAGAMDELCQDLALLLGIPAGVGRPSPGR